MDCTVYSVVWNEGRFVVCTGHDVRCTLETESKSRDVPLVMYLVPQKLPQIYTVIACICIGKVS